MTAEVALAPTVVVNGVSSLFILQACLIALIVIVAAKYLTPYIGAAKSAVEAEKGVRIALESVIPQLKNLPAYQRLVYIEDSLIKMCTAAEKLAGEDPTGEKRSAYVLDAMCTVYGLNKVEIMADKEKMAVIQKSIDMAVASAGLMGKVTAKQLPFRSGSAVS